MTKNGCRRGAEIHRHNSEVVKRNGILMNRFYPTSAKTRPRYWLEHENRLRRERYKSERARLGREVSSTGLAWSEPESLSPLIKDEQCCGVGNNRGKQVYSVQRHTLPWRKRLLRICCLRKTRRKKYRSIVSGLSNGVSWRDCVR